MKFINICIVMLITLFWATNSTAQSRDLIMLHGHGGDETAWQVYDGHFSSSRNSFSSNTIHRLAYDTDNGLDNIANDGSAIVGAGTDVLGELNDLPVVANSPNTIGFALSFGGLALREAERVEANNANNLFGGYVTVGTPNEGTPFGTSFTNGDVQQFFLDGTKEVVSDPISSIVAIAFANAGQPLWEVALRQSLLNAGINLGFNGIYNAMISTSDFATLETIEDLSTGSTAVQTVNNFTSTKPRIAIWGNEQRPVHWRFIESLTGSKPKELALNAVDDDGLANSMNNVETGLNIAAAVGGTVGIGLAISGALSLNPVVVRTGIFTVIAGVECRQGAKWLRDSEAGWNHLIGSDGVAIVQTYTSTQLDPNCLLPFTTNGVIDYSAFYFNYYMNMTAAQRAACWMTVTQNVTTPINGESDGLVHRYATRIPNVCHIEIALANHQELVNHPNATEVYDDIFEKETYITTECGIVTANFFETF